MTREKKSWLKEELQKMLDVDIIRPSVSPFASPVTIAPKEDGSFRLCTDYRTLNQQTAPIPFSMPRIDSIIDETGGCQVLSRIDFCKGFWQVHWPKIQNCTRPSLHLSVCMNTTDYR